MKKADDYVICFLFCPKKVRGTGTAGNNKNRDDFSSLFSFYKVCSNQLPKFFARISIKTRLREGFANAQAFAGVAETGGETPPLHCNTRLCSYQKICISSPITEVSFARFSFQNITKQKQR